VEVSGGVCGSSLSEEWYPEYNTNKFCVLSPRTNYTIRCLNKCMLFIRHLPLFLLVPSDMNMLLVCEFHIRLNLSDTGTLV
jgi:hypothetical protein